MKLKDLLKVFHEETDLYIGFGKDEDYDTRYYNNKQEIPKKYHNREVLRIWKNGVGGILIEIE